MRLALALGVAFAAIVMVADAEADRNTRVFVRHGGSADLAIDANEDGWISRAEASSAAERMFADLDEDGDGRLTAEDRQDDTFEFHIEHDILEGGETRGDLRREIERAHRDAERALRDAEARVREAERDAHDAERLAETAERRGDRVIIIRSGDRIEWEGPEGVPAIAPLAPLPPVSPLPPGPPAALLLLFANSEEADRNGDGGLSREEFLTQQLRFFDASDANGDGRVRFAFELPEPPEPPAAPVAPAPPVRR